MAGTSRADATELGKVWLNWLKGKGGKLYQGILHSRQSWRDLGVNGLTRSIPTTSVRKQDIKQPHSLKGH